ncbi:MAG: leucyl/phenylalanyl-tRNA--protein transferase [Gammaproteobacteria bacterium]|nr:leucyl/phenylalanyl-tRNA--protein transferase [Gammaproteobacteria bacterium]MDH5175625.1 leucyl/phenylalanyl-tRNA--protein transferase [Gammaproteobacteria bacterium]MDH5227764.1 leucyl/phenylalanyl-tRNA--protein transferase [Gammaproteobacteria bacterium]
MIPWLKPGDPPTTFPPVTQALTEPDGLLCAGGDLQPARILAAYRRGIFPWYSEGQPILWWSPDPRMVLYPGELKVSRSLRKTLRQQRFRVTLDTCFDAVMVHCGDSGTRASRGTWILPAMRQAYGELHRLGHAHSVEVWLDTPGEGTPPQLVGGLYGLLLGRVFFGESMFSTATDASKVALHRLVQWARAEREVELIDCQVASDHLFTLGARLIPRAQFVAHLERAIPRTGPAASANRA